MSEKSHSKLSPQSATLTLQGYPPEIKIHAPLQGDHQVYSLVGQVASEFARAEHFLDVAIWRLSNMDDKTGACITGQLIGVRPRCLCLLALGHKLKLSNKLTKSINTLMNDSHKPSDIRNRLIHDSWYVEKITGETAQFRSMPKDDYRYGHAPVSAEDVQKALVTIKEFAAKAEVLKGDLLAALPKTSA